MVVDTSAVMAILLDESDAELYEVALAGAPSLCMSAVTTFECALVLEVRHGPVGGQKIDQMVAEQRIEIVTFDLDQLALARAAFARFGRGRHPAGLNFGDCFSYALAKHRAEPLLFKGEDFAKTDVESVL
jgi:ribonuclease VapC